jgi:N-sulfoglucosamine sulfohydrolase
MKPVPRAAWPWPEWIVGGLIGLLLPAVPALRGAEPPAEQRPNILFAMADDWAYPHAGVYGDRVVRTPTFDRVARDGMLFTHAHCVSPSCTPSRAAVLTGQWIHRLEESGNLHSILQKRFDTYPDLLEAAGYHVGLTGKGWGPGLLEGSGRTRNPAGPTYKDFAAFLKSVPEGKPFCYWFGSRHPHRNYVLGSGVRSGLNPADVFVPPYLPDAPQVRSDICDYYEAVRLYDSQVGEMLDLLEKAGKRDNTIVIMTGDNGWPFPRGKANLYDAGTHQPLAIRWPQKVKAGKKSDAFISFQDFAPTFLEAAHLKPTAAMTGRSFLDLLTSEATVARERVFVERERHANVRKGDLGYPSRALRTRAYLYIRNFHPERWPAGDPERWKDVGPFGDIDGGPTKNLLLEKRANPQIAKLFQLACGKRPAEELYDLTKDPYEMNNVADKAEYQKAKQELGAELDQWMRATGDPRAAGEDDRWDRFPYFGGGPKPKSENK